MVWAVYFEALSSGPKPLRLFVFHVDAQVLLVLCAAHLPEPVGGERKDEEKGNSPAGTLQAWLCLLRVRSSGPGWLVPAPS